MSRVTHAAQIDVRLRDEAGQLADFGFGVYPSNFASQLFHLL